MESTLIHPKRESENRQTRVLLIGRSVTNDIILIAFLGPLIESLQMSQNATTFQTSSMPAMTSSIKENSSTSLSQLTSTREPTPVALTESQLKGFVTQQTVTSEPTSPKESLENTSAGELRQAH